MTTNCMSLTEVFTDVLGFLSKAALRSATGKENITFTLATLRIPANLEDSFDRSFGDPNSPWDPQ
jgi:hypothetical protein